jgi:hypothetical protein
VAFLADLGHLQEDLTAAEYTSNRQIPEVKALYYDIFSEITKADLRSPGAKGLYFILRQQAYLAMPVSAMSVTDYAPGGVK